jgi:hypothetical protein
MTDGIESARSSRELRTGSAAGVLSRGPVGDWGLRDLCDDTEDVMKLDAIARFKVARNGLRSQAREADLAVGIIDVREIYIQRNLPMNTDGLDLLDDANPRALQHG